MIARNSVRFFLSLALVSAAAWLGSMVTLPAIRGWYAALDRPFFSPPDWVFAPVWTVLYLLMAISLYLVWSAESRRSKRLAFGVFAVQLVLNVGWSVVFFGLHLPWAAVGVIVALWLAIGATIAAFWPIRRLAAYLLVPYLAWVSFAMGLNLSIAMLNSSDKVDTYEECVRAPGSRVMELYPAICTTKDKKQFTAPDQQTNDPPVLGTLSIPELGATIQLPASISDAYYRFNQEDNEIYLTTTRLETAVSSLKDQCTAGLHGLHVKKEGNVLSEQPQIEILCMPAATETTRHIYAVQASLRTAIQNATIE